MSKCVKIYVCSMGVILLNKSYRCFDLLKNNNFMFWVNFLRPRHGSSRTRAAMLLLTTLIASLTARTLAISSVTPITSSPIKVSTLVKSSNPTNSTSSIILASSSTTKRTKSSVAPLLAAFSPGSINGCNERSSPPIKSTSSVTRSRIVPPAAPMIATIRNSYNRRKSLHNEPLIVSIVAAPENPLKRLAYDHDEPEDLKDLPLKNNNQQVKPGIQPSSNILNAIKKKLQQGNDDYLDKLSGHRRMEEDITRTKIVNLMRYKYDNQVKDLNTKKLYTIAHKLNHTNNMKNVIDSSERKFLKANRYLRRSGVTTPSQYEIKPYRRKHRAHTKRKHAGHLRRIKHRYEIRKREHVKRRNENKDNFVINTLLSSESAETTPVNKIKTAEPIITLRPTLRLHFHKTETTSVATRPTVYEVSTTTATTEETPMYWKSITETSASPLALRAGVEEPDEKDGIKFAGESTGPFLTTLSAFKSEKKQKKLEKFVKFINKNRGLLREFISKKKSDKAAKRMGKGYFRGGMQPVHLNAHHLDLSPGKGNKIEELRAKGRICQRNLMIPEGPKYNSMGCTYMPEFKKVKGHPDYPATKPKRFLIPACCNCCKKSVLGCE